MIYIILNNILNKKEREREERSKMRVRDRKIKIIQFIIKVKNLELNISTFFV